METKCYSTLQSTGFWCGVDGARTRELLHDRNIRAANAFRKQRFLFDFPENLLPTDIHLSQNVYQYRHIIAMEKTSLHQFYRVNLDGSTYPCQQL